MARLTLEMPLNHSNRESLILSAESFVSDLHESLIHIIVITRRTIWQLLKGTNVIF